MRGVLARGWHLVRSGSVHQVPLGGWWGSPGLVGLGVGDDDVVVGVAGEGPGFVVDEVVVVPTQPDQVRHECLAAVSGEGDVVGFVDS